VARRSASKSKADAGAAYVFNRSAGAWRQQAYLKASNTGVGGNGANDSASSAGAAYVYDLGSGGSTFTVGGTVSGLAGSGLVLRNNGGDDLAIGANGSGTLAGANVTNVLINCYIDSNIIFNHSFE
jgi:hypothetical protein